jgi:hypothetical protein
MRGWIVATLLLGMLGAETARADWKEPSDKQFTEKQLTTYLETAGDWAVENGKFLDALARAKTADERKEALRDVNAVHAAVLQRHQMSQAEYDWMAQRVEEAWAVASNLSDSGSMGRGELAARQKANDDELADARKRLAAYEEAAKLGHRVFGDGEREEAIAAAKADLKAAEDEVNLRSDEGIAAQVRADASDAEAAQADARAAHPPSNVGAGDRQNYIDTQKSKAQQARSEADDARARLADAIKQEAESRQSAEAAKQKIANPEVPVGDDEIASVKREDEAGIAQAKADVEARNRAREELDALMAREKKIADEMKANVPAGNVELMKKYSAQFARLVEKVAAQGMPEAATRRGQ